MSKHTGIDHSALSWVKKELDETLKQAAEALESYTQQPEDATQLQFCATHLHQVHGILQMLELFGAALLVEEMEQVGEGLLGNAISQRDDAYDVLMRAILQLSDYLERIQSGYKDMPILLLPLLNDLRAVRGAKLLTENAVFAPNLDSTAGEPRRLRGESTAPEQLAKSLRHRYQLGLLGYLRERDPKASLAQMLEVLDKLDAAAGDDQAGTVWWVGAGMVEALQLDGLPGSTAVKMLLGQVDRQIKRLTDEGETALAVSPPKDLIRNLLYYVGRAEPLGERVPAIQAQYELKDLVLDEAQIEQARDGISGPNTEILETVGAAIKEDLATVKDALDLFVRGGQQEPSRLAAAVDTLSRIGDTLGVLGLGMPRAAVKQQLDVVESLQNGGKADDQQLMEIARALLFVESALDGLINRNAGDQGHWLFNDNVEGPEDRERSERELFEFEYRQVFGNALGEAVTEVGRAKEQIVKFIETGAAADLEGMDQRFEAVRGALDLLGQDAASALLRGAQRYVADHIVAGKPLPEPEAMDALADAITSIEYYLESVVEGRAAAERILEVAESSLERLGYLNGPAGATAPIEIIELDTLPEEPAAEQAAEETFAFDLGELNEADALPVGELVLESAEPAESLELSELAEPVAELAFEESIAEPDIAEPPAVEPPAAEIEQAPAAAAAPIGRRNGRMNYDAPVLGPEIDEDILEIFLEEAEEVLETIHAEYPKWRNNPDDQGALTTCRRMFHTLKGSGRLAGALRLGELSWSIENLFNRVLDNTVPPDARLYGLVDETLAVLPAMIEQVRGGDGPEVDVFDIVYRAELLSDPTRYAELQALTSGAIAAAAVPEHEVAVDAAAVEADIAPAEAAETLEFAQPVVEIEALEVEPPAAEIEALEFEPPAAEIEALDFDQPAAEIEALEFDQPVEFSEPESLSFDAPVELVEAIELEMPAEPSDADSFEFEAPADLAEAIEVEAADAPFAAADDELVAGEVAADLADATSIEFELPSAEEAVEIDAAAYFGGETQAQSGEPIADAEIELQALPDEAPLPTIDDATIDFDLAEFGTAEPAEPEALQPAIDPVLYDIFSREAFTHLMVVQGFVDEGRAAGGVHPVTEALVRALHTLTGSARMADVQPIALLGRRFETYSEHKFTLDEPFGEPELDLLARSVERIYSIVEALGEAGAELPAVDDLMEELEAAAAQLADAPPRLSLEAMLEQAEPLEDEPTAEFAIDEIAADEPSVELAVDLELEAPVEPPLAEDAGYEAELAAFEAAHAGSEAPSAQLGNDTDAASDRSGFSEMDADLVELFLEEAQDILQFLESTVQRWEDAPDHENVIAELHRSLHTLKGGARLAGFNAIGTLCHVLEGISTEVADHKIPGDDTFFNLLHAALDSLAAMVGQAKQGELPRSDDALLERMAELRGHGGGPRMMPLPPEPEGDLELIEVFLEEAAEILAGMETSVSGWIEQPEDSEPLAELQRALHTLKGGARMAGFIPIADLSHNLETLLIDVIAGSVGVTPDLFDLLERCNDRLFSMRDQAEQGTRPGDARELLAAIEDLRLGKSLTEAPASAEPAPVAETPRQEEPPAAEARIEAPAVAAPQPAAKPATPAAEPVPVPEVEREDARGGHDIVRVRSDLLDNLVNYAGEVSIYRSRLDQQIGAIRFNLTEFDQTVTRLREQLRTMDIETEAQILYRFDREYEGAVADEQSEDFDPLELDRFSRMQEISRALSESVNDLLSIQNMLDNLARESETLLLQQSRVNTDLQDGLMRTRMVPFANLVPRMRRIVRQTCSELDKRAQFKVLGAQGEMDRTVLERVVPPLEHMLRNAVAHGVESPEKRAKAGKSKEGTITVALSREGADVVIRVSDDGGGLNLEAIRNKAVTLGMMPADAPLSDREVMQFILEAGFSTAESVSQIAGRGVGMDVVSAEIKQLGGTLEIDSTAGEGTTFTVRLPFTLAISQALLCRAGDEVYAIPLSSIEGVVRMGHDALEASFANPHQAYYDYAGSRYDVRSLAQLLGVGEASLPGPGKRSPIILVQTGDHRMALQVDGLLGNREIVVKSVGAQISTVPGIFGATILGDGRVVLILDVSALARLGISGLIGEGELASAPVIVEAAPEAVQPAKPTIMVVDDSITMRKVATRLLERNGMNVVTAKDGVDAVAQLQEVLPDAMLLDIEMPRMDGYELATHMRNDERLKSVPIIMITSRTGEKHRQRAMEIGVNRYLGKPYQESELLENLSELLEERRARD